MFGLLSCLLPLLYANIDCPSCENGTDHTVCLVTTSMFSTTYWNTRQRDNRTVLFAEPESWGPLDSQDYDACGCLTTTDQYKNQLEQGFLPHCSSKGSPSYAGPMLASYA